MINDINGEYFLGYREESEYKTSDIVVIPVSYEGTVSFGKGTKNGARSIIKASYYLESYDEEFETQIENIHTFKPLVFEDNAESKQIMYETFQACKKVLNDGKMPVMIGGEHSLTLALAKALKERYKDYTIIQIDAHTDLDDAYGNNKYSHASVMKRIHELGDINIVQIGIRSITKEIHEFVKQDERITTIFAHEIKQKAKRVIENQIKNELKENVFITIDVDGFDPSIFPNTGTPEPNGLEWQYTIDLLKKVLKGKKVIGLDFMEHANYGDEHYSDFSAAKLIYKLLCLFDFRHRTE